MQQYSPSSSERMKEIIDTQARKIGDAVDIGVTGGAIAKFTVAKMLAKTISPV